MVWPVDCKEGMREVCWGGRGMEGRGMDVGGRSMVLIFISGSELVEAFMHGPSFHV